MFGEQGGKPLPPKSLGKSIVAQPSATMAAQAEPKPGGVRTLPFSNTQPLSAAALIGDRHPCPNLAAASAIISNVASAKSEVSPKISFNRANPGLDLRCARPEAMSCPVFV